MKTKFTSRFLSLFLALMMVICLVPVSVFADETNDEQAAEMLQQTEEASAEEPQEEQKAVPEEVPDESVPLVEEAPTEEPVDAEENEDNAEDGIALMSYDKDFSSETHDVFKHTESTIAPGVEQYINYAYAKDGKQMVYYVATADISRDDVLVQSAYKDAQCQNFGMDKLTNQMAAATAKYSDPSNEAFISEYYTAVAGTNADFYNMTTGQPSGAFVMDGVMASNKANNRPWFAIFADGTALCGTNNADWDAAVAAHGDAQQAVGGSQVLVKDGADVTASASGSYNTDRHSRTMVGVTADGKVVMAVLDGRQEPFSCGGTMHELAQIMLEAECVSAINLDGGGSTTFAARPEGENAVKVINRPSDGSERSISSGLIVASTAVPSDVFARATLTAENEYVTPGSTVQLIATGVSPAGTAAEIPEDVSWQLADGTFGTVENGVFTSNGTVGDAVVQMVYNGNVVGEATIHVVVPETLVFDQPTITLPYGKSTTVSFTATYGLNTVALKEADIAMVLENPEAAQINGFEITAGDESNHIAGTKITATLACGNLTAEANLVFGKGSEVVQDFENFEIPDTWTIKTGYPQYGPTGANGQNEKGSIEIVTAENGKVHSGDHAFAINVDMTQLYETGYHLLNLSLGSDSFKFPANATAFGFWMYVPEDTEGLYARWNIDTAGDGKSDYTPDFLPIGLASTYLEAGWHYYSIDLSKYDSEVNAYTIQIYVSDRDNSSYNYYFKNQYSVDSKYTLYMDDITVDYSNVVDDREAPVFTSVRYADQAMSDAAELKGQTVADNIISFGAVVHEDATKNNYTGIDDSSAKAYIDGVAVECTYSGGTFGIQDAVLADGVHTVAFEIADKMGNVARVSRKINIQAGSDLTYVNLVPQTPNANKIPIGSIQWYDLKTNHLEQIDSITTKLNLNSVSNWELAGMTVAAGFEASYVIDEVTNDATITITKTGDTVASGEAVIASIPARTWVSTITNDPGYETSTPASLWSRKIIWPKDIKLSADYGLITFADGSTGTFSSERYQTITELYGNYAALNANGDYANKTSWHIHTVEALEDKAATCTEAGYTGRTFCEVCNSVVDWGTTIPATGHSYDFVDGVLKCTTCGELFTGEWTDGKVYKDGVVVSDGWVGSSYYQDGVKLTGVQKVPAVDGSGEFYYDFGDSGVSAGKYTGLFYDEAGDVYRYSQLGELSSGWKQIDDEWYYFYMSTMIAATGTYKNFFPGIDYEFEETGKLVDGVWFNDGVGMKYYYGPSNYKNVGVSKTTWTQINGNLYAFDNAGYRLEGVGGVIESNATAPVFYDFGSDGICRGVYTGLADYNAATFYCIDGIIQYCGLIKYQGAYYYADHNSGKIIKDQSYFCYVVNDLMPRGTYTFSAEGKMVDDEGNVIAPDAPVVEPEKKNGIIGGYYYVDDVVQYCGLIEYEGAYYYVDHNSGKIIKDQSYFCYVVNDLMPRGTYTFNAEGKMVDDEGNVIAPDAPVVEPEKKNGIIGGYYYVDDVVQYCGLIEYEGAYYYVDHNSGKIIKDQSYFCYVVNDLMPRGTYTFNAEGRMVDAKGDVIIPKA